MIKIGTYKLPDDFKGEFKRCRKIALPEVCEMTDDFEVETLEGTIFGGKDTNLLMRGNSGEYYPIGKKIFEQTYEIIDKK